MIKSSLFLPETSLLRVCDGCTYWRIEGHDEAWHMAYRIWHIASQEESPRFSFHCEFESWSWHRKVTLVRTWKGIGSATCQVM